MEKNRDAFRNTLLFYIFLDELRDKETLLKQEVKLNQS